MSEISKGAWTIDGSDPTRKRWNNLKDAKIIIPYESFKNVEDSNVLYLESASAYVLGLPNSSLIQSVRCLELALRKRLEQNSIGKVSKADDKNKQVSLKDARLYDLIEFRPDLLIDKNEVNYLKSLRNKIHDNMLINDLDALHALDRITKEINHLFPFEGVDIPIQCPYALCHQKISFFAPYNRYVIGNTFSLDCDSGKHMGFFNQKKVKVELDGITKFTITAVT